MRRLERGVGKMAAGRKESRGLARIDGMHTIRMIQRMGLIAAVAAWANQASASEPPVNAVQWRVAELVFEGGLAYACRPDGVRFEAVFRGPDGGERVVPGFWDGGRTWRIRFTPERPGEWTYETRAIEEDVRVVEVLHAGKVLHGGDAGEQVDVALDGCVEMVLAVTDAGDGSEYDHADWGDARFVRRDGTVVPLDDLEPLRAEQGHGTLARGKNLLGGPLQAGGVTFRGGLGSHSPGRVVYRLDGGEARFLATVGVDGHVGRRGSVRFEVCGVRSNKSQIGRRDPGLHGQRGRLVAAAASGDNPLHRHGGFLRVAADGHSLTYADGTPFFWLGDTWWFCPSDLVPLDGSSHPGIASAYKHLLEIRRAQGFSTVHMAFLGTLDGYNPYEHAGRGAGLDPEYWRKVDRYMDEANAQGMVPVIGLGWSGRPLDPADWRLLWRHVIARYGAHAVTWLVCGEYNVRGAEDKVADTLALGQFIKETDPYKRAMTVHPWYFAGDRQQAWGEPWHDFIMVQGGHGGLPPVEFYQQIHARRPAKPLLEAECRYEGIHTFTDKEVREAAWRAVMGGSFGFTYGSQGLWYPTQHADDRKTDEWGKPLVWWESVRRPGAAQLRHFRDILESAGWWRLEPRPGWVVPVVEAGEGVLCHDLGARFAESKARGAHWSRLGVGEPARIELHPPGEGEAVLEFPRVELPGVASGEKLCLITAFGFSPGALLNDPGHPSDGVCFSIRVEGREVASVRHHAMSWVYQNVDLTPYAGKAVEIVFATAAAGNMNWDHAAFRRPLVLRVGAEVGGPMRRELSGPAPREVLAKADDGRVILLYVAAGEGVVAWQLRPLPAGARYRATWRDPRSGAAVDAGTLAVDGGALSVPTPPGPEDWVLLLERQ